MPSLEEAVTPVVAEENINESCPTKEENVSEAKEEMVAGESVKSKEVATAMTEIREQREEEEVKAEEKTDVDDSTKETDITSTGPESKTVEVEEETKTEGVVLRKRKTPEKKEGKDEVSPPKKMK